MTPGRRALLALLDRTKREYIAGVAGVARSTVQAWFTGTKRPSARARRSLFVHYGIPPESWDGRLIHAVSSTARKSVDGRKIPR